MSSHPFNGRHEDHALGELTVVPRLQRTPAESRIRGFLREGWIPEKQGVMLVANLQDGEHAGDLHVFDGGTRLRFGLRDPAAGPEYVVPCWVCDMTEAEAAYAFDVFNRESKKPTAFETYTVGIVYGDDEALAVKAALDSLGLTAGERSDYATNVVGAVAALRRIVGGTFREYAKLDDLAERWARGSDRLAEALEIGRAAYQDDDAHHADMLQAIARLRRQHGEFAEGVRAQLVNTIATTSVARWQKIADEAKDSAGGGSESRGTYIALSIATEHNANAEPGEELRVKALRQVATA